MGGEFKNGSFLQAAVFLRDCGPKQIIHNLRLIE
jgi:hypothetical protein